MIDYFAILFSPVSRIISQRLLDDPLILSVTPMKKNAVHSFVRT